MDKYMGVGAYPRSGTHTVEVSLQWGEYKGAVIVRVKGNVIGASVIDSALDSLVDGDFQPDMSFEQNRKHIVLNEIGIYAGYVKYYKLINGAGGELQVDYDDIAGCIVSVRIVGWEAE